MAYLINATDRNDRLKYSEYGPGEVIKIRAKAGSDQVQVTSWGIYHIYGDAGNDTLEGFGFEKPYLYGGSGKDTLLTFFDSDAELFGGAGNDNLRSSGGEGNEVLLDGGTGADTMHGSKGRDIFIVDNLKDVVFESYVPEFDNEPNPRDEVRASVSWTLGTYVEDLTLTGQTKIDGIGNALANALIGNDSANTLDGKGGNDSITGGGGRDQLFGRSGNDSLSGGGANDRLFGGSGRDTMLGGASADTLVGEQGNDMLSGGTGRDVFVFGRTDGKDTVTDFRVGEDRLSFTGSTSMKALKFTQVGADVEVTFGATVVIVEDVSLQVLKAAGNFIFA